MSKILSFVWESLSSGKNFLCYGLHVVSHRENPHFHVMWEVERNSFIVNVVQLNVSEINSELLYSPKLNQLSRSFCLGVKSIIDYLLKFVYGAEEVVSHSNTNGLFD